MSEKNSAAGMPAVERVHTVDDVKTALEASATAIHEAIHIARENILGDVPCVSISA